MTARSSATGRRAGRARLGAGQGLAAQLSGADPDAVYVPAAPVTRLKASGIDLAAMGSLQADPTTRTLSFADPARGTYARLLIRDDRVAGAVMLGDNPSVGQVIQLFDRGARCRRTGARCCSAGPSAGGTPVAVDHSRAHARRRDRVPVQHGHQRRAGALLARRRARPGGPRRCDPGHHRLRQLQDAVDGIVEWLSTLTPVELPHEEPGCRRVRHGGAAVPGGVRRAGARRLVRSPCWPRRTAPRTTGFGCRPGSTTTTPTLHLGGAPGGVEVRLGEPGVRVDRERKVVHTSGEIPYDALVLATGSRAFVPPFAGADLPGCLVYRTHRRPGRAQGRATAGKQRSARCSAAACSGWRPRTRCGCMGVSTHVVEFAPRLMPLQVDEGGGAMLKRHIEALGVTVHTGRAAPADGRRRRTG